MGIVGDILRSWRRPRAVMRRHLAAGLREDRALACLMGACFLIFVAQLPRLARESHLSDAIPLDARVQAALLGWIMLAPLLFYALAALVHLLARLLGGRGSWFSARYALFWALLASTPAWLLHGLTAGFAGPGAATQLVGAALLAALAWLCGASLAEAEALTPGAKPDGHKQAGPT